MATLRLRVLLSLFSTLFVLTLLGLIPSTHSRAVPSGQDSADSAYHDWATEHISDLVFNSTESHSLRLEKRGQCTQGENNKWTCAKPEIPSIEETRELGLNRDVLANNVGKQYFYANLGGRGSISIINRYCRCRDNPFSKGQNCVGYPQAVRAGWVVAESVNLNKQGGPGNLLLPRMASQALAEECSGDVAFFTAVDKEPGAQYTNPEDLTWIGWEFPALKLNKKVERIWRIDPREPEKGQPRPKPELIWSRGDDESGVKPPRGADQTVKALMER